MREVGVRRCLDLSEVGALGFVTDFFKSMPVYAQASGPSEIDMIGLVFGLVGGLVIFLFGMERLTESLKVMADKGMHQVLGRLTGNRFVAAATGALVTAVIQSSSVTTVLVVGFISAGLMTLTQSVGVIMGANIGTTITAQIIAFKVTDYAMGMIAIGSAMAMIRKFPVVKTLGLSLFGLGLVFLGMGHMSEATYPLRSYEPFIEVMQNLTHPIPAVLAGALFTALVQSSSATTGIVIVLASQGFINLETGIAIALGANIGTCVTAVISSIGKPRVAVQAAAVHVLFNLLGALIWLPLIPQLAELVRGFSPESVGLTGTEKLAAEVPRQIANAHTVFNVATTAVFIWFTGPMARLVERILPVPSPSVEEEAGKTKYLDKVYLQMPAMALQRVRMEIGHLGELTVEMLKTQGVEAEKLEAIDSLFGDILKYFRKLGVESLAQEDHDERDSLLNACHQIHAIADTVRVNLKPLGDKWGQENFEASERTRQMFKAYVDRVSDMVAEAVAAVEKNDPEKATTVINAKSEISGMGEELMRHLGTRLASVDGPALEKYRIESEIVEIFRRIFYHAKRAAKAIETEPDIDA